MQHNWRRSETIDICFYVIFDRWCPTFMEGLPETNYVFTYVVFLKFFLIPKILSRKWFGNS